MDQTALVQIAAGGIQGVLNIISVLHLTAPQYPKRRIAKDGDTFDYIIVGGGVAGSIVANRLTENPNVTVALLETGDIPPIEARFPVTANLLQDSIYDFSFPTKNDNFTARSLQGNVVTASAGKVLGGSSTIVSTMYNRGTSHAYQRWAEIANDTSWNYEGLLKYFIRSEQVQIPEINNSPIGKNYGVSGNIKITREYHDVNKKIISAFQELGYQHQLDLSGDHALGITEGIFAHSDKGINQNTAEAYLRPAKERKNLLTYYKTTVTKILFDDNKNTVGVEAFTPFDKTVKLYADKEVILAAGVFKTPQLLLLSGVGPKTYLDSWDIPVISDVPVGKSLAEQTGAMVFYKLNQSIVQPSLPNIVNFPFPLTLANSALDPSNPYAEIQTLNIILTRGDPLFLLICTLFLKYNNNICNKINGANSDLIANWFILLESPPIGTVGLNSKNPLDDPLIDLNSLGPFGANETSGLEKLATFAKQFTNIANTTFYSSNDAKLIDFGFEECDALKADSLDYWKCYVRYMSNNPYHFTSSAPMGSVLDSRTRVRGVQRLRVVDAAGLPYPNGGKTFSGAVVFAEKASDLIKEDNKENL